MKKKPKNDDKSIYQLPFVHPKGKIAYVPASDSYMQKTRGYAKRHRSNLHLPSAVIIVKNSKVIGRGSIGNNRYHKEGCIRINLNMPTGQGYELCEGCDERYHSEASA